MSIEEFKALWESYDRTYLTQVRITCQHLRRLLLHYLGGIVGVDYTGILQQTTDIIDRKYNWGVVEIGDHWITQKVASQSTTDSEGVDKLDQAYCDRNVLKLLRVGIKTTEKLCKLRKKLKKHLDELTNLCESIWDLSAKEEKRANKLEKKMRSELAKYRAYQDQDGVISGWILKKLSGEKEKITNTLKGLLRSKVDLTKEMVESFLGNKPRSRESLSFLLPPFIRCKLLNYKIHETSVSKGFKDEASDFGLHTCSSYGDCSVGDFGDYPSGPKLTAFNTHIPEVHDTNIFLRVIKDVTPGPGSGQLTLKIGDIVKQKKAMERDGCAFGWIRPTPKSKKVYGYYPVGCALLDERHLC